MNPRTRIVLVASVLAVCCLAAARPAAGHNGRDHGHAASPGSTGTGFKVTTDPRTGVRSYTQTGTVPANPALAEPVAISIPAPKPSVAYESPRHDDGYSEPPRRDYVAESEPSQPWLGEAYGYGYVCCGIGGRPGHGHDRPGGGNGNNPGRPGGGVGGEPPKPIASVGWGGVGSEPPKPIGAVGWGGVGSAPPNPGDSFSGMPPSRPSHQPSHERGPRR